MRKKSTIIGLDIQPAVVRFVEIDSHNPQMIYQFGEVYLPGDALVAGQIVQPAILQQALLELSYKYQLEAATVVFAPLTAEVVCKTRNFATEVGTEARFLAVEEALETEIHLPFYPAVFDLVPSESTKFSKNNTERTNVTFVATSEKLLRQLAEMIVATGNYPETVDIASLAMWRLAKRQRSGMPANVVLADIHFGRVDFSVFEEGQLVYLETSYYHQQSGTSLSQTAKTLAKNSQKASVRQQLYQQEVENGGMHQLIQAVQQLVYFYGSSSEGEKELEQMLVTGDHPALKKIVKGLQKTIRNLDVRLLTAQGQMKQSQRVPHRYQLAYALAKGKGKVNLLPTASRQKRAKKRDRTFWPFCY